MSQNKRILAHLKSGKRISSWQAIQQYQITRLAARILDLKKQGHLILSHKVEKNGKRYAEYSLN